MSSYQTHKIGKDFLIKVLPHARGFSLSDLERQKVDQIWHEAQSEIPGLHNGQFLNFVALEKDILLGEFIDYKFYYAQLKDDSLKETLLIQPIAISGITKTADKVLVGQRSDSVTLYKNFYELVPSGGIDPDCLVDDHIDLTGQFEKEFWEETGLSVTEIKEIKPFALIFDPFRNSYEICAEIHVHYLAAKEEMDPSSEYSKLLWISKSEIYRFIQKHKFVPFSLNLISGV